MLSVSYAGKNAYSAGKTFGVLRVGASGANRGYALAHCGGGGGGVRQKHNFVAVFFLSPPIGKFVKKIRSIKNFLHLPKKATPSLS